jgi:hypothetical protein
MWNRISHMGEMSEANSSRKAVVEETTLGALALVGHVLGSVTNNNGFLDWMTGFINTFVYNLS